MESCKEETNLERLNKLCIKAKAKTGVFNEFGKYLSYNTTKLTGKASRDELIQKLYKKGNQFVAYIQIYDEKYSSSGFKHYKLVYNGTQRITEY